MDTWDFLLRIAVGTGVGAVLGLEREVTGKAAGLRTHAMVGLGSAVFTALSIEAFGTADPSRVAAQIVSGIGFLGAGAIFRSGPLIKGLTTAAGLWAAAALGMAAGAGHEAWALVATGVGVVVLLGMRYIDDLLARFRTGVAVEAVVSPASAFMSVREDLVALDPTVDLEDVSLGDDDSATLHFVVGPDTLSLLTGALKAMESVTEVNADQEEETVL